MSFYQLFLPIATLIYFLFVFVLRSIILWRQTGVNPFVFGHTDRAHDYVGRVYKVMILFTWVSIGLYSFFPNRYPYLLPINYLDVLWLKTSGLTIFLLSFLWTSIAQYQMSKSWRIGIDYDTKPDLVSKGLFKISRNPIFLWVLLSYLGTFLIIPNVLSFSILLVSFVAIQIQVRLEEEYLESAQGNVYLAYKSQVRRWI